jgi:DNA-binding NarL/FixJ family response regulator
MDRSGPQPRPPARILVVDDEPLNVDYLEQELEGHGFEIETATNGVEALERVADSPPDLVLLDVMMPEMDGIRVLRILKSDPATRLVPVVLMTALNAVEDRVRGIEAGADDFLSKPVDDRELLARINTALALKRAIDETFDDLRSTSAYLERYGRGVQDVAVLALEWRSLDRTFPEQAVAFLVRRQRATAEECIRAEGGLSSEADAGPLVAVFDGADARARALAALEAARAILDHASTDVVSREVRARAAISLGRAQVGSIRETVAGKQRWLFGAEGEPVDRALALVGGAADSQVVVADDVADLVSDLFTLAPSGEGAHRLVAAKAGTKHEPHTEAPRYPSGERGFPAGLTAREVDVLRLVAAGLSDAEAAQQLVVSVRTVNAHLRSIYRKVGVHSRAAAGRFAIENDLV